MPRDQLFRTNIPLLCTGGLYLKMSIVQQPHDVSPGQDQQNAVHVHRNVRKAGQGHGIVCNVMLKRISLLQLFFS